MPVKVKIELNGLAELKKAFKELPVEVQKKAALPATRAAASVGAKAVRAVAPVGTHKGRKVTYKGKQLVRYPHTLKSGIWVKRIKRNLTKTQVGYIVSVHPLAWYYRLLVDGFVANGTAVPPNPFFDRAEISSQSARQAAFDQAFANSVALILAKLSKAGKG